MSIKYNKEILSSEELMQLYKAMLKPRMIEEKFLVLLRQGKVSKWFSGIGQEAIAVGSTLAMNKSEYILPMHRNLGVFTSRNIPLNRLFAQFQGKMSGFTKGRDRSFHFGTQQYKIVGMISHLGPQMGVADGIALADLVDKREKATLVFTGEGGSSEGDFHEAINVASVWNLPVIFLIENNGYGLSTPTSEQYKCKRLVDRAVGYGIDGFQLDGNNIIEVYSSIKKIAEDIRKKPRPVLVECITFRRRGHEEASGVKYVPKELISYWEEKDPVLNFEKFLVNENILNEISINEIKNLIKVEIEEALLITSQEKEISSSESNELYDVYMPYNYLSIKPKSKNKSEKRFVDAISDGLKQSMQNNKDVILMGQDVAEYGGVFKITEGFINEFGKERIRNTPICESAIVGAGLGLSINNKKAVIEMQFADFVTCGFNQIVNNLAKSHFRWSQNADVVVRMPTGAGVGAGPFHSQSNEAWFTHTPGLKVVYPSNPYDAKGLLAASINDPNPVMFFEHKALYRSISESIPDDYYTLEIGKARNVQFGQEVSIITYGMGVHWVLSYLKKNPKISVDLIDLRTLAPLDEKVIIDSVKKTGKALILQEDVIVGSIANDITSLIQDKCFQYLDAPIKRIGSLNTPVPFSENLEQIFLPTKRFEECLSELLRY